jgi:molybdopterin-dependent oxidoreductase alpha subunit
MTTGKTKPSIIPVTDEAVEFSEPADVAGGVPAVVSTMKHAMAQMGVTRGMKTLMRVNQTDGFDCPGCAWPDPRHRTPTEFCENGAKAVAEEATTKRIDAAFFRRHALGELRGKSGYWLGQQGRLTEPMVCRGGSEHYEPIDWSEAEVLVAKALRDLASPDEAVFYTSGRTSNEAAFLLQLFVRMVGTNNLPDCSNLCHESSGVGLGEAIGIGKGTVQLEDFDHADVILIVGQNPGTNHPRMLTTLQRAARRGAKIVSINPLREAGLVAFKHPQELRGWVGPGTPLATHFLQVRINGDVALLKGLIKTILETEEERPGQVLDHPFIDEYTVGFESFVEAMKSVTWDDIVQGCGVEEREIREVGALLVDAQSAIACWAMGLTQHKNAVSNIQEVVNLLLLRGHLGKPGAGVCPVRGHSNVQGDRTVGITSRPKEAFLDRLGEKFEFSPPRDPGLDTVHALKAMAAGEVSVFFGMGGNLLSAAPDTDLAAQALQTCKVTIHVATKLNRSHVTPGEVSLLLPCLGRTEVDRQTSGPQFVSVENSMGIVHRSQGRLPPASAHLRSEPAIVAGIATAFGGRVSGVDWQAFRQNYDRVRDAIECVVPGFDDYNKRVREPHGFALPNPVRSRQFNTASRRAMFTVHSIPVHVMADDEFMMMTIRSHDQFNTTIYGLDDRYRGVSGGRRVAFFCGEDLRRLGILPGARVDLFNEHGGRRRVARSFVAAEYDLPRRSIATYFPEANVLIPIDSFADRSHTPTSKSVVIRVQPAELEEDGARSQTGD